MLLFGFSLNSYSQNSWKSIRGNSFNNDSIRLELENTKIKVEKLNQNIFQYNNANSEIDRKLDNHIQLQNSFSSNLSNQLDTLNSGLTIWGILFGLLGVLLAAYITYMQYITRQLLKKTKKIKSEVTAMQADINSNLDIIYEKLNQKEIDYILNRIKLVPQDVEHLFSSLASRDLNDKYFYQFKDILNEWDKTTNKDSIASLITLIAQHFPNKLILDEDLMKEFLAQSPKVVPNLYEGEKEIFLQHYSDRLNKNGIDKNELKILATEFNKTHPEIYTEIIYTKLKSKSIKEEIISLFEELNLAILAQKFKEKFKSEYPE